MTRPDPRFHLTGAAGTGTTTLGRTLAGRFGVPHLDTDDFYWMPTDPPYTEKRPVADRVRMMREARGSGGWVISGSLVSWGNPAIEGADLIVFLSLGAAFRLARLRRRERARFGNRIAPGGDMATNHAAFIAWAAGYDDPRAPGRSRAGHEAWMTDIGIPILRLVPDRPVDVLCDEVAAAFRRSGPNGPPPGWP